MWRDAHTMRAIQELRRLEEHQNHLSSLCSAGAYVLVERGTESPTLFTFFPFSHSLSGRVSIRTRFYINPGKILFEIQLILSRVTHFEGKIKVSVIAICFTGNQWPLSFNGNLVGRGITTAET